MLEHYPLRHLDKTKIETIASLNYNTEYTQIAGRLNNYHITGERQSRRLIAYLNDGTGEIELTWFQGISWVEKTFSLGQRYLVFGKLGFFNGRPQMVHPEMEIFAPGNAGAKSFLDPVYPSTEKLKVRGFNGRALAKLTYALLQQLSPKDLPENLPETLVKQYRFISRWEAYGSIHFPATEEMYTHAVRRLKFEELFFAQVRLGLTRGQRHRYSVGCKFEKVGSIFTDFYEKHLPFSLTGAQKRVLKEIRQDTAAADR